MPACYKAAALLQSAAQGSQTHTRTERYTFSLGCWRNERQTHNAWPKQTADHPKELTHHRCGLCPRISPTWHRGCKLTRSCQSLAQSGAFERPENT